MKAARFYGPRDIRIEEAPEPQSPAEDEVLLAIKAVGICGSDLHVYRDSTLGGRGFKEQLVMGHEFAGEVVAAGTGARDGENRMLQAGQRVAVEPHMPCGHCELCESGHPNLCIDHTFLGIFPTDGALQERLVCPARFCFPIPESIGDGAGALLEPLGVAMHAVDLAKIKVGSSVAVIGCGPIGLLIQRLARMAGAGAIYAYDYFPWRAEKARAWGASEAWAVDESENPADRVQRLNGGRGVDLVFEAAWANESVQQAVEMTRPGGRIVLVGVSADDVCSFKHSTARHKGLTLVLSRRMKHTYPRAIRLAAGGPSVLDLDDLVSHRLPLNDVQRGFEMNLAYEEGVHKIVIGM